MISVCFGKFELKQKRSGRVHLFRHQPYRMFTSTSFLIDLWAIWYKWCLKVLSKSLHCASCSSCLPSTSSPSGSLHQQATYSSFSVHPSVFFFSSFYLCISSLKPSLPHSLSIMLLSCSDSALFFHFFHLFLSFTLITLPVAEDDVCRLVILTLIC